MDTLPLTTAWKEIKYLGENLTKKVEDLYNENVKPLEKEIEKDTRKWKGILCSQISSYHCEKGRFSKSYVQNQYNPNQNPQLILHRNRQHYPKMHM